MSPRKKKQSQSATKTSPKKTEQQKPANNTSPKKTKKQQPTNTEILCEQIQLMKTEKELKISLEKVKDHINKLLVEELELKSALARTKNPQMHTKTPKVEPVNPTYQFDSVNVVNEQKLDLFLGNFNQSMEEYDDE